MTHMEVWDFSVRLGSDICISRVEKSNGNSIEFSLSNAEQRAVGLIPAQSLAL